MIQITQQNMLMLQQISFEIIAYLDQHRSEPELSKQAHEVVADVFSTNYTELWINCLECDYLEFKIIKNYVGANLCDELKDQARAGQRSTS